MELDNLPDDALTDEEIDRIVAQLRDTLKVDEEADEQAARDFAERTSSKQSIVTCGARELHQSVHTRHIEGADSPKTPEGARRRERRERRESQRRRSRSTTLRDDEEDVERSPSSESNDASDVVSDSGEYVESTLSNESPCMGCETLELTRPSAVLSSDAVTVPSPVFGAETVPSPVIEPQPASPDCAQPVAAVAAGCTVPPPVDPQLKVDDVPTTPVKPFFRASAATEQSKTTLTSEIEKRKGIIQALHVASDIENVEEMTENDISLMRITFSNAASLFGPTEQESLLREYDVAVEARVWNDVTSKIADLRAMLCTNVEALEEALANGPAMITTCQINYLRMLKYDENKSGNKKLKDMTLAEARREITALKAALDLKKTANWG